MAKLVIKLFQKAKDFKLIYSKKLIKIGIEYEKYLSMSYVGKVNRFTLYFGKTYRTYKWLDN